MPLTAKGAKILASMKEQYGDDEGERVFYASANAGKITGVHETSDELPLSDSGHYWVALSDAVGEFKGVEPTVDGYLKGWARVARVGTQRYRGGEVGVKDKDWVTLYRPPEEVFAHDAMHSMANKPVTLTHPKQMVNKRTWTKVARGISGTDVVRDGEYVRVPLMLTDAEAIDAYETGIKELSVGYTTDIDWTPGQTPSGDAYDGVQRSIRANHHALVPVARGGRNLVFGDAVTQQIAEFGGGEKCPTCHEPLGGRQDACPKCGTKLHDAYPEAEFYDRDVSAEERESLAKKGHALPGGGYPIKSVGDLKNAIQAFGRAKNPAATKALIKRRAKELGAEKELPEDWDTDSANDAAVGGITEEGVMPIIKNYDGLPVHFADEQSAAIMDREWKKLQMRLADVDTSSAKKMPDQGDDDDVESEQEREKKERGYKDALAAKDGEIAILKKRLKDSVFDEARQEEVLREREAIKDAARKVLGDGFDFSSKTLADIRRATVIAAMGDAKLVDGWDDAQVIGAFRMATMGQAQPQSRGFTRMADGMSSGIRASAGQYRDGVALSDKDQAYNEYCKRISEDYKRPFGERRN